MVSGEDFPQENQSIDIPYPINIPLNHYNYNIPIDIH